VRYEATLVVIPVSPQWSSGFDTNVAIDFKINNKIFQHNDKSPEDRITANISNIPQAMSVKNDKNIPMLKICERLPS
jgi:hypothetical protein